MTSPKRQTDKRKSSSRATKYSIPRKKKSSFGSSNSKVSNSRATRSEEVIPGEHIAHMQSNLNARSQAKKLDVEKAVMNSNKSANIRRQALPKLKGRTYILRSFDGGRMLRSMKNTTNVRTSLKEPNLPTVPQNLVSKKRKRWKKKGKKFVLDELSRIKKHIRYLLNRMKYEHMLIDAYVGEGWKGLSAEKIRPEKELERARSEINRCKLKMREIFKNLDSLMAEGRLPDSLFDPDGIYSENIFCGKCGLEEVSADNDIILCDGICQRGFHQKCLNPPLLSEYIPAGDDDWLCPQCDCKADCIDLLSELGGMDLSIEDSWERIFPEATALENKKGQFDELDLPSDDSEDDDYDPEAAGVGVNEQNEESSFEELDSSYSSDDSISSHPDMTQATLELLTDDSEDNDYDPDAPDIEKEIQKGNSSSDESDFTSDSDEFCTELGKATCTDEATASSLASLEIFDSSISNIKDNDKFHNGHGVPSVTPDVDTFDGGLSTTLKRRSERLSCMKLNGGTYSKGSSDTNNSEACNDSTPKKMKIDTVANNFKKNHQSQNRIANSLFADNDRSAGKHSSSVFRPATVTRHLGSATMKLNEVFQENQYPTRQKKESLARDLGMTFKQVTKWFDNARHSFRASAKALSHASATTSNEVPIPSETRQCGSLDSAKESCNPEAPTADKVPLEALKSLSKADKTVAVKSSGASTPHKATDTEGQTRNNPDKMKLKEAFEINRYPSKETKEKLAKELCMTFNQVTIWFDNARRARSSMKAVVSDKAESKSRKSGKVLAEKISGALTAPSATPDEPTNASTIPPSHSPLKLDFDMNLEVPGVQIANGNSNEGRTPNNDTNTRTASSHSVPENLTDNVSLQDDALCKVASLRKSNPLNRRKTTIGAKSPEDGSEGKKSRVAMQGKDRGKAIAKELRRMRWGR
ncbi:hypothetical protein HPP92_017874 [Vanilla planifolia]|uniref:Uncharacterized protein n=1 Tax=Vanilla planifolia TaxID=51239 RepID=A0A835Q8R9_VANPL|nr:hypothetical protein HPP92_017874 [Vanilla planifolia]